MKEVSQLCDKAIKYSTPSRRKPIDDAPNSRGIRPLQNMIESGALIRERHKQIRVCVTVREALRCMVCWFTASDP